MVVASLRIVCLSKSSKNVNLRLCLNVQPNSCLHLQHSHAHTHTHAQQTDIRLLF